MYFHTGSVGAEPLYSDYTVYVLPVILSQGTEVVRPAFCAEEDALHTVLPDQLCAVSDGELFGDGPPVKVNLHLGWGKASHAGTTEGRRGPLTKLQHSIFVPIFSIHYIPDFFNRL